MSERIFNEEEISRIIKRAAELESERQRRHGDYSGGRGLSLDELVEVASGTGIDPESVRQAVEELNQKGGAKTAKKKAGVRDKELFVERWLDHIPHKESLDHIIADLDHRYRDSSSDFWHMFGKPKVKRNGKSVEWFHTDTWGTYETRVLMQPVGNRYRIRISRRNTWGGSWDSSMGGIWMYLLYFVIPFVMMFSWFMDAVWLGAIVSVAAFFLVHPVVKKLHARFVEKHKSELEGTADEMVEHFLAYAESAMESEESGTIAIDDDLYDRAKPKNQLRNELRHRDRG